jgi:hypothetical protein
MNATIGTLIKERAERMVGESFGHKRDDHLLCRQVGYRSQVSAQPVEAVFRTGRTATLGNAGVTATLFVVLAPISSDYRKFEVVRS